MKFSMLSQPPRHTPRRSRGWPSGPTNWEPEVRITGAEALTTSPDPDARGAGGEGADGPGRVEARRDLVRPQQVGVQDGGGAVGLLELRVDEADPLEVEPADRLDAGVVEGGRQVDLEEGLIA